MTPSRWERVKDIFDEALALNSADRRQYLDSACASDCAVRAEVERLLSEFERAGDFIEAAPRDIAPVRTFTSDEIVSDRYRIVSLVGKGGMGEVYEAEDLELRERIALKTLHPSKAAETRAVARFRQEIQLARRVTHPNVCRIFDMGTHNGIAFLTMELLEGETLAARLERGGGLPKTECLPLARQMAAALSAAHKAGIIHRDFKPANVMLIDLARLPTRAVVMDFGIAHSLALQGSDRTATATGVIVGTPAYMAPEQFLGVKVTQAADIYAFGMVLHEMLTGTRPPGASAPARERSEGSPALDARFERVIRRCLDPDPEKRFQDAEHVLNGLENGPHASPAFTRVVALMAVLLLAILLAVTGALAFLPPVRNRAVDWLAARRLPQEKNLAILPFVNIGSDPGNQPFCDGLLEVATSTLTQVSVAGGVLRVVPSSEIRRQAVKSADDAYRLFNANLVITGSIQRNGNHVRITANLVDARSKRQLRSQIFDFHSPESMPLQEAIVARITELLNVDLAAGSERVLAGAGTTVPAANEAYLKGVGYLQRYDQPRNLDRAILALTTSIEGDRKFTAAHVALSAAFSKKYQEVKSSHLLESAGTYAANALALDPLDASAHVARGVVQAQLGNQESAMSEFRRALGLDARNVEATRELAKLNETLGNIEQAEATYKQAIALRRDDWLSMTDLCVFYNNRRRYSEAASCLERVVIMTPTNWIAYRNLGGAYASIPKYEDAERALRRSLELAEKPSTYSSLGAIYIYERRYGDAIAAMEKAVALMPDNYAKAYVVWSNLGDAYRYSPDNKVKAPAAYRNAIADIEKNLARDPNNVDLLSRLAVYWSKSGRGERAIREIGRALESPASNSGVLFRAAVVYSLAGKTDKAVEAIKEAVRRGFPISDLVVEPELENVLRQPQMQSLIKQIPKK